MYQFLRRKDIPYIILTIIVGSANHFLYEFSKHNPFTALLAPVNESTWEHLKLLFFPFLLFTAIQYYIERPRPAPFFASRLAGVCIGMLSVVLLFYAYTILLGRHILFIDICLFLLGVICSYYSAAKLKHRFKNTDMMVVFYMWFFVVLVFFIFTCYPPESFIFLPPL